jgi:hypothetical protein
MTPRRTTNLTRDESFSFLGFDFRRVNYFRVGHSSRCFKYVKNWVEKKIRRHMMRARGRKGFGRDRWSREWLYQTLGLYRDYRMGNNE